ncbi:P-loop NTPase fold protein [Niastella populi]|nr:P-loop NTPase fold protein [Niastella populi]
MAIKLNGTFIFDNLPHKNRSPKLQDKQQPKEKEGNMGIFRKWNKKLFKRQKDNAENSSSEFKPFVVGRDGLLEKFGKMLESGKGVFLVTGYRGMGKTSFVNIAISEYNDSRLDKNGKLTPITLTISSNNPTETEIFQQLVGNLKDKLRSYEKIDRYLWWERLLSLMLRIFCGLFVLTSLLFLYKNDEFAKAFSTSHGYISVSAVTELLKRFFIPGFLITTGLIFILLLTIRFFSQRYDIYNRLDNLDKRCHAAMSFENDSESELSLEQLGSVFKLSGPKKVESYPIASAKEIEGELNRIINKIADKLKRKFIFIFDELDKVEQPPITENTTGTTDQAQEKLYFDQLRTRVQAIQQIISGLKSFFTNTEAPFVFIAGREMFDASMADIADRQSSISSIFTYVFYIDSLLKKNFEDSTSLSTGIQEYLYQLIHHKTMGTNSLYDVDPDKYQGKKENYINDAIKVNLLLQNFVVYLTYRSNGSPKKLIRLIHEFVRIGLPVKPDNKNLISIWGKGDETGNFLYFDFRQQQRIGFISYLYRPFIVRYGTSFKKYSDHLVVSLSFLFDHFLKFHPFAFSLTHLELMPEVLSASRTPALRDHIKHIIEFLSLNHIRETEIGLFDYKYYNKTVNEMFYLSKTFEEESAAFNFTLDESYLIKQHVRKKLKDIARNAGNDQQGGQVSVYSNAYLNGILGDLHSFDQEYDEAIIAYSEILRVLQSNCSSASMKDYVIQVKYKLKLGLVFEKVKSFEEALALYSDAVLDTKNFIYARLSDHEAQADNAYLIGNQEKVSKLNSSLSDLLQIANQAFLAKMVIQEKMGVEGITSTKTAVTLGGFLSLADRIGQHCGTNTSIISNFFMQLGNLLYLKNSIRFAEWHPEKITGQIPQPYLKEIEQIINFHLPYVKQFAGEYRVPVIAMNMYILGMQYVLKRIDGFLICPVRNSYILGIIKAVRPRNFTIHNTALTKIHYKYIANYLSHLGDCLLSMLKTPDGNDIHQLKDIFDANKLKDVSLDLSKVNNSELKSPCNTDSKPGMEDFDILNSLFNRKQPELSVKTIVCCYYLSAYYFQKASRIRSYSFQLRKILYLFRLVLGEQEDKTAVTPFLYVLEKLILAPILETASHNSEFSDLHDQKKFEKHFDKKNQENGKVFPDVKVKIRHNLSNFPDTREGVILFAHIKLKIEELNIKQLPSFSDFIFTISTQYMRLIELTYCAKLNEKRLELKKELKDDKEIARYCLEYVHCLVSIVQIMDIYDNDYLLGNGFLAYHYLKLGRFFTINNSGENNMGISRTILDETRLHYMKNISPHKNYNNLLNKEYNYEMGAHYYDKAIKLHSGGDDYKSAINDILYLEDDLNDAAYHFGAAMDRYLLVNDKLINGIKECRMHGVRTSSSFNSFIASPIPSGATQPPFPGKKTIN